jgi:hypothetical protein
MMTHVQFVFLRHVILLAVLILSPLVYIFEASQTTFNNSMAWLLLVLIGSAAAAKRAGDGVSQKYWSRFVVASALSSLWNLSFFLTFYPLPSELVWFGQSSVALLMFVIPAFALSVPDYKDLK